MQIHDRRVDERRDRHGEDRAGDTRNCGTCGDDEHDGDGVQRDRVRHHEGLQDVGLDLLDDQDNDQHDDRLRQATVDGRNQDRDDARGQGTQNRNKGGEECDDANRDGQRHAEEESAQRDADSVNRGDLDLRAHVGPEGRPAADRALVDGDAGGCGQQAHAPQPNRSAFLEEEEQTEEHR